MSFDVGADSDSLLINNIQFYPPSSSPLLDRLYAYEVPTKANLGTTPSEINTAGASLIKEYGMKPLLISGYGFHFDSAETISEDGIELLPMTFKITSLEGSSVTPPEMTVYVIKDPLGHLSIASVKVLPVIAESSPKENESSESKECKDWPLLCKWKSILADKLNHMKTSYTKGCHKGGAAGRPFHKPPHVSRPPHYRPSHDERPPHRAHPHHHHGGHHRHHRMHGFLHGVMRVVLTVLVPIFVGIAAGMATYLVGMIIGCTVALIWAKVRGRTQDRYVVLAQDEEEGGADTDKEVYLDEKASFPAEAPPLYDEVAEKEVVTGDEH